MSRDFRVGQKLVEMGLCIGPESAIFGFPLKVY